MQPSDGAPRYTRTAIALHWLIAILVIGQFAWGWWMQEIPKQPVGPRVDAFNLHKSVGMTIFLLMALRVGWRRAIRRPVAADAGVAVRSRATRPMACCTRHFSSSRSPATSGPR